MTQRACLEANPLISHGALGGTRTPNLLIRSQMLYPLSYERLDRTLSDQRELIGVRARQA